MSSETGVPAGVSAADEGFAVGLLWLCGAGLALRIAEMLLVPTLPISDFHSYYQRAQNLVMLGSYSFNPARPDATFPPGYSLLLAGAFKAVGAGLLTAKAVNAALGTAAIGLSALLARSLWGPQVGLATGLIVCLYPRYLLMTGILASENLFQPLLLCWALLVVKPVRTGGGARAALVGAMVGLLTLTRSVAYPLGFVWPTAGVLAGRSRRALVRETLILLVAQHLVMLPWAVRNEVTLGRFSFLNAVGGIDLFIGNNSQATGEWFEWRPELERLVPDFASRSAFERDAIARRHALSWIQEHPAQALELYVEKLRLISSHEGFLLFVAVSGASPQNGDVLPDGHPLKSPSHLLGELLDGSYWLVSLLQLVGCILAIRGRRHGDSNDRSRSGAALLVAAAYFPLAAAVFLASQRFRWPSTDLLMPLAGLALVWLGGRLRSRLASLRVQA